MKSKLFAVLLVLILPLATAPLPAAEERVITAGEAAAKRDRVLELRGKARELRHGAEVTHKKESADCRKAVLMNNCLTSARDRRLEKIEQARAIEIDIGALERDIRRFELAERRTARAKKLEERNLPTTVSVDGASTATLPPGPPNATPSEPASPAAPAGAAGQIAGER